jgi:hypothetical protein
MAAAWVVAATSEAAVAATMAVADRMAGDTEADMAEHTAAVATTAAEPTRAADMQAAAILDQPPAVLPLLELGPGKDAAAPATLRPAGTALTVMAVHPLAPVEQITSHAAAADGNWHSFGSRTSLSSSAHTNGITSVNHATVVTSTTVWHGGAWGSHWGYGWGWGHPGWNWGWGWGWGCCGWGWGGWGWGFGVGFGWGWGGWGAAWSPFWAWPPYYYNPWLYAYSSPPSMAYPYSEEP